MNRQLKTVLIVVALLVGIGVFNYIIQMDPTQLAARGVGKDPHSHGEHENEEEGEEAPTIKDLQEPIGPEGAPVTITVLWQDPEDLAEVLRPVLTETASSYEGKVRVEFVDPQSDKYKRLVENVTDGVMTGLLINGEMIKEIPEADLHMLAFSGSPSDGEWGPREIRLAVEHELEKKGVEFESQVEHVHGG